MKLLISLLLLSLLTSCFGINGKISISAPIDNYILTTDENIVPKVSGTVVLETEEKDEKKLKKLKGEVTCNGVKAQADGVLNLSFEALNVPIEAFKNKNLKCVYKSSFFSTSEAVITVISKQQGVADPGEEGMKTLAGIDSDNDGVRDDVQIWINQNYSQFPSTKIQMMKLAKNKQLELLNAEDKEQSIISSYDYLFSFECLSYTLGDSQKALNESNIMDAIFMNTEARVKAQLKSDSNFHGQGDSRSQFSDGSEYCNKKATKEDIWRAK